MTARDRRAALHRRDLRGVPVGHLLAHLDLDEVGPLACCPICSERECVTVKSNPGPRTQRHGQAFSAFASGKSPGGRQESGQD